MTANNDAPPPTDGSVAKPAVGAFITGLFVVGLGYLAASAQGMTTAPSRSSAAVAMAIMLAGAVLALCGLASFWWKRLRKPARTGQYLVLALLVGAFVIDRLLGAFA